MSETKDQSARRPRLALSRELPNPTEYVKLLNGDFAEFAYNEERAPNFKGKWRELAFNAAPDLRIDLEIGTGNGYHFSHLAVAKPTHGIIGIEIKFKPLIQSIKRARAAGAMNARIIRYDAGHLDHLFMPAELNDIYIHHPDPWPKKRNWKHRLIQTEFLDLLYELQRPGSFVDFKTDSLEYYDWSIDFFRNSKYRLIRETRDLHHSEWNKENFITHFESIFLAKGQPIFYARLEKPSL